MRTLRRPLVLAATLSLAAVTLAACSSSSSSSSSTTAASGGSSGSSSCSKATLDKASGPVTINFWESMPRQNGVVITQLVDAFNASQSKVHVNLVAQTSYNDTWQKYQAGLSNGQLPDVVQLQDTDTQAAVDTQSITPVQSCWSGFGYSPGDLLARALAYWNIQHVQEAMPFAVSGPVLYYNQLAYQKAGLDPAKPPAGYSLCHGGHCHADDGRLVDYAEVQTELLGKTQGNTAIDLPLLATMAISQANTAAQQTGTAAMPLGNLASLQLSWRGLRLHGKVWDARPGSPRLPADGVALTLLLPADSVSVLLDGHTGPHQPLRWHTAIDLDLPASWLDSFDPAPLAKDATVLDLTPDHPAVPVLNEALHGHVRASLSVGHPPR